MSDKRVTHIRTYDLEELRARYAAWYSKDPSIATWGSDEILTWPAAANGDSIGDQMAHYIVEVDVPLMQERLAAAERELAEQRRINASNLQVMTGQLELARQKLSDAPHGDSCVANVWTDDEQPFDARPCDCWKAGL